MHNTQTSNRIAEGKLTNTNDHLLLKRAIYCKDKGALESIHNKFYPKIRNYIFNHLSTVTEVEDLTQDVFVELSKSNINCFCSTDVEKYLYGMAKNIIRKHFRNKKNTINIIHIDLISSSDSDECILTHVDPSHKAEVEEIKVVIRQALSRIPPKACQAITMKYIDGLSSEEAAEKIGCSVNTFYQRLHNGKNFLLKYLKKKFVHVVQEKKYLP